MRSIDKYERDKRNRFWFLCVMGVFCLVAVFFSATNEDPFAVLLFLWVILYVDYMSISTKLDVLRMVGTKTGTGGESTEESVGERRYHLARIIFIIVMGGLAVVYSWFMVRKIYAVCESF